VTCILWAAASARTSGYNTGAEPNDS
jgi:hypothetical protein